MTPAPSGSRISSPRTTDYQPGVDADVDASSIDTEQLYFEIGGFGIYVDVPSWAIELLGSQSPYWTGKLHIDDLRIEWMSNNMLNDKFADWPVERLIAEPPPGMIFNWRGYKSTDLRDVLTYAATHLALERR